MYYVLVLCLFQIVSVHGKQYDLVVENMKCDITKEGFYNLSCTVHPINSTTRAVYMEGYLRPDRIFDNAIVKLSAFMKKPEDQKFHIFLGLKNLTVDFCKLLSGSAHSVFFDMIVEDLRKSSNILHPCPFSGYIYMKNWIPDDSLYPPQMPAGQYMLQTMVFTRIDGVLLHLSTGQLHLTIKPRNFAPHNTKHQ